jgi:hypothetical protein
VLGLSLPGNELFLDLIDVDNVSPGNSDMSSGSSTSRGERPNSSSGKNGG